MNIFKRDKIYFYNKKINIRDKPFSIRKLSIFTVVIIFCFIIAKYYIDFRVSLWNPVTNYKVLFLYFSIIIFLLITLLFFHDYRKLSVAFIILIFFLDCFEIIYFQLAWYKSYDPIIDLWLIFTIINLEKDILKGNKVP